MRHILIAIVIVAVIVGVGLVEQIFVTHTMQDMIYTSDSMLISLRSGDIESSTQMLDGLMSRLKGRQRLLELFFSHNEFRDVPSLLGELHGTLATRNIEESITRTEVIRADAIAHLNILSISIENIL